MWNGERIQQVLQPFPMDVYERIKSDESMRA